MNQVIQDKIGVWLMQEDHSKQKLASELGFTVQTLKNRLDGTYEWSWNEMVTLAKILDCSITELA
jgi:DNA-binding XRE family transcriptional regulator